MFTALAASNAITASEIVACIIIRILAQRGSAAVSAGDDAVLVLKAKNIPNAPTLGPNWVQAGAAEIFNHRARGLNVRQFANLLTYNGVSSIGTTQADNFGTAATTPEPSSLLLVGTGLSLLGESCADARSSFVGIYAICRRVACLASFSTCGAKKRPGHRGGISSCWP